MGLAPGSSEGRRLADLHAYEILDTEAEAAFDDIARAASFACETPIATVTFIDERRQWFKSHLGLDIAETAREIAFCAHALGSPDDVMIVRDARADPRFAENPLVLGPPHLVFYAGAPVPSPRGSVVGTVAVMDHRPRDLDRRQVEALRFLARTAASQLELRKRLRHESTEKGMALSEIVASERRYRDLYERNLAGFYRTTTAGEILACNPAFARMLGYESVEDLKRRSAWDLYFEQGERTAIIRNLQTSGHATMVETRLRRRNGTPLWILESYSLTVGSDGMGVIEGTAIDITHRRQAEEALRSLDQAKTNFMIVASHEMRTPLTIARGYLELVRGGTAGEVNPLQASHLAVSERALDRMAEVVHGIVISLAIEQGRLRVDRKPFDLATMVSEMLGELQPFYAHRGQAIRLDAAPGLRPLVADPAKVRVVVENLVSNAVRFTPDGGRVTVRLDATEAGHHIAVADNGVGLSAAEIDQVFDRFYAGSQPDHHRSGRFEFQARGTGLGLAIVRGYVEAHGGRAWAESPGPGRGSTFHVVLPSA